MTVSDSSANSVCEELPNCKESLKRKSDFDCEADELTKERVLCFNSNVPKEGEAYRNNSRLNKKVTATSSNRYIRPRPEKVLDAPGFENDYYNNLLAWSNSNKLALGLRDVDSHKSMVFLFDANGGKIYSLLEDGFDSRARGVAWCHNGHHLAVGLENGTCEIFDGVTLTKTRTLTYDQPTPIPALSWSPTLLTIGNEAGQIISHDLRIKQSIVAELESHTSRVCSVQWRSDGGFLASGGNDNTIKIFDARKTSPVMSKTTHIAAVKAISWCPWNLNHIASGGGLKDHKITIWNIATRGAISSVDTGSPVLSLVWGPAFKELVSTHGDPNNSFCIWEAPELCKVKELPAHDYRVLQSAISPDGLTYCTVAADSLLKLWAPFTQNPLTSDPDLPTQEPNDNQPPVTRRKPFGLSLKSNNLSRADGVSDLQS